MCVFSMWTEMTTCLNCAGSELLTLLVAENGSIHSQGRSCQRNHTCGVWKWNREAAFLDRHISGTHRRSFVDPSVVSVILDRLERGCTAATGRTLPHTLVTRKYVRGVPRRAPTATPEDLYIARVRLCVTAEIGFEQGLLEHDVAGSVDHVAA